MKRLLLTLTIAALIAPLDEVNADEMTDALAPQYIYMELCKDWPPLLPDRLRAIDAITKLGVDAEELKKSVFNFMLKFKLIGTTDRSYTNKKTTEFCSRMAALPAARFAR
jgi:hypothetical protein